MTDVHLTIENTDILVSVEQPHIEVTVGGMPGPPGEQGAEEVAVSSGQPTGTPDLWVNPADVGSGYPTSEISVYKMMWSGSVGRVSTLPPAVNVVRLAFAQGSPLALVGYAAEGRDTLISDLTAFRATGRKVTLSLGGDGGTINTANPEEIIVGYDSIKADLAGNLDGIDWDVEMGAGGMDLDGVVAVSTAIAARGDAVTFAPHGGNIDAYLPVAVACYEAGAMDSFGQQFYSAPVTVLDAKYRINQAIAAGIPIGRYAVGMMIGNASEGDNLANYWTNVQCHDRMAELMGLFPGLQRAYIWHMSRTGTPQWITDMDGLLPEPTTPDSQASLKYRDPADGLFKPFPSGGLTQGDADDRYVELAGDAMTGQLNVRDLQVGTTYRYGDSYAGVGTTDGMSLITGAEAGDDPVVYLINERAGQPVQIRPGGDNSKSLMVTTGGVVFSTPAVLPADPVSALQAATKQYVDNKPSGAASVHGSPKIRTGFAKRDSSRITIVVLGDSMSEGALGITAFSRTWPARMAQGVRGRLGLPVGGPGWKKPMQGVAGMQFPEGVVTAGTAVDRHTDTGVVGAAGNCTIRWDTTGATSVDVYVWHDNTGNTSTITSELASTVTVSSVAAGVQKRTITNPGIFVQNASTGVSLGVSIHNGDETVGVEVVNLSLYGLAAASYVTYTAQTAFKQLMVALDPDVLIVELGANDAINGLPAAGLQTNLQQIVTDVLAQVPRCAPAIFTPYDTTGSPAIPNITPWRAAMVAAATALGCPVVDNVTMPGPGADTSLYYTDLVHLSDAGAAWMGDHTYDTLVVGGGVPTSGTPGPTGPAGPPGGSYLSAQWNFNQNTVVSPASGTMRMNATTYAATTTLWIHETDRDGLDRSAGLSLAAAGDQIIMQSAQGRAVWNVVSQADSGVYRTLTVTLSEQSGTRPSASSTTTLYILNNKTGHPIQDEGTPLTYRTGLNFVGAGVTATSNAVNDRIDVTIPGSAGGTTILSGTATPDGAVGAVGDYYLDTDDRILYGPKSAVAVPDGATQHAYTSQTPESTSGYVNSGFGMDVTCGVAGYITGLRYYRSLPGSSITLKLWDNAGTMLAQVVNPSDTGTGWKEGVLATPISVSAGQKVRVSAHVGATAPEWPYKTGTGSVTGSGDLTVNAHYKDDGGGLNRPVVVDTSYVRFIDITFVLGLSQWPVALKSVPPGGTTSQVLAKTSATDYAADWAAPGGGGGGHTVQDEGTPLTARTGLNFIGAGVTATDDAGNNRTNVTISSGGVTAHSGLTGLTAGDDHTQYHNDTRGDARYLRTTGGTLTGDLTFDKAAGTAIVSRFTSAGSLRWTVGKSSTAESGGNAGSEFGIVAYSDTGTLLGTPLSINRTDGVALFQFGLDANTQRVKRVATPSATDDAATKAYVDGKVTQTTGVVTPAASWQDFGSTYAGLWLTRVGALVTIEGIMKRITSTLTIAVGTFYPIGTVPSGFRPVHDWTGLSVYSLGTGLVYGEIVVTTAGDVSFSPSAGGTVTVGGWVTLAGSYRGA